MIHNAYQELGTWNEWFGDDQTWDQIRHELGDSSVYQSSRWGQYKMSSGWHVRRYACTAGSNISAVLQILYKQQGPGISVAWSPGGITGCVTNLNSDFLHLISSKTAPVHYARIGFQTPDSEAHREHLKNSGLCQARTNIGSPMSLVYELNTPLATRLELLSHNWKRNLTRSHRLSPRPYLWTDPDPDVLEKIHIQLVSYKKLSKSASPWTRDQFVALIAAFRESLVLFRCDDKNGEAISVRGVLIDGNRCWDIIAATNESGRKNYSSYAVFWELANHLAKTGITTYDLGGVDPVNNKGVHDFKRGTRATEITYLGEWDLCRPRILHSAINSLISRRSAL